MPRGPIDWEELERDGSLKFEKSAWKSSRRRRERRPPAAAARSEPGLVLSVGAKRCTVQLGAAVTECRLPSQLAARQKAGLAVGDLVDVAVRRGVHWIEGVRQRTSELSRPDPRNPRRRRVIAANVELVVIVSALRRPGLRPGLIDRYLLAVARGGAEPLICINKADLAEGPGDEELARVEPYRELGHPVFLCAARTGEGIDDLRAALAGRLCVLVGHSGVGKSSLLNALQPRLELETRPVRHTGGSGRHTTTRSNLYRLPNGSRIIDTPGIREFGLWDLDAEELAGLFPEFAPFAAACRFANCSHTHEPGCAVKQAVEAGEIPGQRYDAYLRIRDSLE